MGYLIVFSIEVVEENPLYTTTNRLALPILL
jgi:hypothetical protein